MASSVVNSLDGRYVNCWLADCGNVFVFANVHPQCAESELLDELYSSGCSAAAGAGCSPVRAEALKILLYSVQYEDESAAAVALNVVEHRTTLS